MLAFEFIDYQEIWRNFWRMIGDEKMSKVAQMMGFGKSSTDHGSIWSISMLIGLILVLFYLIPRSSFK